MESIKPEEFKELIKDNNIQEEIIFEQITDNSLKDMAELQKIFPHWTRENAIKKMRNTISGKDMRFIIRKNGAIIAHLKINSRKRLPQRI